MLLRCLKDFDLIQVSVETSLRRDKFVNLTQETSWYIASMSKVGRFYLHTSGTLKNLLNRSILLTYQLRRHDDVSSWSKTFKLVSKMGQFTLGTRQYLFWHLWWFSLIKVSASLSLQCRNNISLIQVLALISLRRVKLVSVTQVSIGTSFTTFQIGWIYHF